MHQVKILEKAALVELGSANVIFVTERNCTDNGRKSIGVLCLNAKGDLGVEFKDKTEIDFYRHKMVLWNSLLQNNAEMRYCFS